MIWGLLGPGKLSSERRTRTLGVGASIRRFNELAVPGVGNVWYAKQLMLATFGVRVAELVGKQQRGVTNIVAANSIEALACWVTLHSQSWQTDPRLRGSTKLHGKDDLSFRIVRQPSFYVTQPMRMRTVTALPMLGLVTASGSRFNTFVCAPEGIDLIHAATRDFAPRGKTVTEFLVHWMTTKDNLNVNTEQLSKALSLVSPLPDRARELMHARLVEGGSVESAKGKSRRRDALQWVESLRSPSYAELSWDSRPRDITSEEHWADMYAGAMFTSARDAAVAVLDALEAHIANLGSGPKFPLNSAVPAAVALSVNALRDAANAYLALSHPDQEANAFCRECAAPDPGRVLENLVIRDGRVLRLSGRDVVPSAAFRVSTQATMVPVRETDAPDGEAAPDAGRIKWPAGISARMRNLFLLNADLHADLDRWITSTEAEMAA